MYLDFFGFNEPPFSITPDPKFVFLGQKHQESLAHLVYGITRGGGAGFVQLTGEVGTGKTTISRLLLEQIPDETNIALILNPTITPAELLENICQELKVPLRGIKGKLNRMVDKLNAFLIKSWSNGENTVVIIDEAQNLPRDTLEQLRLLTNLETDKQKLLQIVLIGQPELRATMQREDLRQLAQRVTARYHLMPLDKQETYAYLKHRINVAGGQQNIISPNISKTIHRLTQGIPRLINILTDRSLLAAYTDDTQQIRKKHIKKAAIEVLPEKFRQRIPKINNLIPIVFIGLLVALILTYNYKNKPVKDLKDLVTTQNSQENINPSKQQTLIEKPSGNQAWNQYFKLWDVKNNRNWHKPQCPKSLDTGMACLRRQGNLKQIAKLNRPVLLQLEDNSLLLLTAMKKDEIGLLDKNNHITWQNSKWLTQQWLGTYFILWPMPAELLHDLDANNLTNWSLDMANTIASDKISRHNLKKWIKSFQKEQGLLADGIIGSETQMALSLMAYTGPTLNQQ